MDSDLFRDTPQLSADHLNSKITGDEPVIKGVNSRILVDRRTAYLAGNLNALLRLMGEQHMFRFRYWNAKISLRKAAQVLPVFERSYPSEARPRLLLEAATTWLSEPTTANAHATIEAAEAASVVVSLTDEDIVPIADVFPSRAVMAIRFAAYTVKDNRGDRTASLARASAQFASYAAGYRYARYRLIQETMKLAQLRAAQVILH